MDFRVHVDCQIPHVSHDPVNLTESELSLAHQLSHDLCFYSLIYMTLSLKCRDFLFLPVCDPLE